MNIFVLCTGRCGSVSFIEAAKHLSNYSSGHESRSALAGHARFAFPANHIEADNRLSWLLGRLDLAYGKDAFYVHLQRDLLGTARSFLQRWDRGIMKAYRTEILQGAGRKAFATEDDRLAYCIDYCDTVTRNIECFLRDKPHQMLFRLENAENDWHTFWTRINGRGDLAASLAEWQIRHNATAGG